MKRGTSSNTLRDLNSRDVNPSGTLEQNLISSSCASLEKMLAPRTPSPVFSDSRSTSTSSSTTPNCIETAVLEDELRVLIYTTCYNIIDGVTLTIRKLEREILAAGGQVCIVSTGSGDPSHTNLVPTHPNRTVLFLDNSVPIFFLKDPNDPALSYHLGLNLSYNTQKEIDKFRPTICHITAPDFTASYVMNYARRNQIPLMGTYHSNIPEYFLFLPGLKWLKPLLEALFRHFYNFFQALYVPTPFIRSNLIEHQQMDRVTDVEIWGRGVDLDRFSPSKRSSQFRERHGIPQDCPTILFVGRLVPEKRVDIFVAVVQRLNAANVYFRAIVVGAGVSEYLLETLENTIHLGWLDGDRLPEAYASSDIFLFPSSVETFGNVTLEAAASGLPLVVEAKCSGHLVKSDVNGYACEAGDVDSFYNGTLNLIMDSELRAAYSEESTALSYTLEESVIVKQMLQNYRDISNEFYEKYDGIHQARDEEFINPNSFRMGMEPRPIGFGCIASVTIRSLQLLGIILNFFGWFNARIRATLCCKACCNAERIVGDEEDDVEMALPTIHEDEDSQLNAALLDSNDEAEEEAFEEENGAGLCLSCITGCLDSDFTYQMVVFQVAVLSFTFRFLSRIQWSLKSLAYCCQYPEYRYCCRPRLKRKFSK